MLERDAGSVFLCVLPLPALPYQSRCVILVSVTYKVVYPVLTRAFRMTLLGLLACRMSVISRVTSQIRVLEQSLQIR